MGNNPVTKKTVPITKREPCGLRIAGLFASGLVQLLGNLDSFLGQKHSLSVGLLSQPGLQNHPCDAGCERAENHKAGHQI